MSLLTTSETKNKIAEQVSIAKETLQIISAFCKTSAVEFIDRNICNALKEKKLLVRFLLSDVISGSTDFSLYEYCKTNGWKMYVRFDLHAKTYVFDRCRCILGSANLTSNGMGFRLHGNYELSSFAEIDADDLVKIDRLFDDSILMTEELYAFMKKEYEFAKYDTSTFVGKKKWDSLIENQFSPKIDMLFTYDFPAVKEPNYNDINCFEFLEMEYVPDKDELIRTFRWSKAFLWLCNFVNSCENKTSYFGELTANLHNTLINDPKPYRKEVKELLGNLLGWIEALEMDNMIIDIPNHSQRVRIII